MFELLLQRHFKCGNDREMKELKIFALVDKLM